MDMTTKLMELHALSRVPIAVATTASVNMDMSIVTNMADMVSMDCHFDMILMIILTEQ